jgi:hypothetical protein
MHVAQTSAKYASNARPIYQVLYEKGCNIMSIKPKEI